MPTEISSTMESTHVRALGALAKANVRPKGIMEFTSVETIKQCAALGMGIACLPTIIAESETAAGKLSPYDGPETP